MTITRINNAIESKTIENRNNRHIDMSSVRISTVNHGFEIQTQADSRR